MIEWVFVSSEAIRQVGHDPETKRMYIDFHHSILQYTFCGVPEEQFKEFINASSIGRFYHENIKDKYQC